MTVCGIVLFFYYTPFYITLLLFCTPGHKRLKNILNIYVVFSKLLEKHSIVLPAIPLIWYFCIQYHCVLHENLHKFLAHLWSSISLQTLMGRVYAFNYTSLRYLGKLALNPRHLALHCQIIRWQNWILVFKLVLSGISPINNLVKNWLVELCFKRFVKFRRIYRVILADFVGKTCSLVFYFVVLLSYSIGLLFVPSEVWRFLGFDIIGD